MTNKIVPSQEQKEILDALKVSDVVKVQAVAGSGKTTTIFLYAQENPNQDICVITYNRLLKDEMKENAKKLKIKKLSINTFHGLATLINIRQNVYNAQNTKDVYIYNDEKLDKWLNNPNIKQILSKQKFDVLVLDEFQDCNRLYWKFASLLLKTHPKAKLLVLGDYRQTIYDFKGSHDWWLNNLDHLIENKTVVNKQLTFSHRLTKNIASFLNYYCFDQYSLRINTEKENNALVEYWHLKSVYWKEELNRIVEYIKQCIASKKYQPDDIFIISDALPNNPDFQSPTQLLENLLVNNDLPVFYPIDEDRCLDPKAIKNKIVFCTPWTSKGRERKLVFYLSFGYSFFNNSYNQQFERIEVDNQTYVGLTRASEQLIVVNSSSSNTRSNSVRTSYKFINYSQMLNDPCVYIPDWSKEQLIDDLRHPFKETDELGMKTLKIIGSKCGKFLASNLEIEIANLIKQIKLNQQLPINLISLPMYTKNENKMVQEISVINSILFTSISLDKLLDDDSRNPDDFITTNTLKETLKYLKKWDYKFDFCDDLETIIKRKQQSLENPNLIESSLEMATEIYCLSNQILNPLNQIDNYGWLNDFQQWALVKQRTTNVIQKAIQEYTDHRIDYRDAQLEIGIVADENNELRIPFLNWLEKRFGNRLKIKKFSLIGIFDLVINNLFIELKFTNQLTLENQIQVIFYLFLLNLYRDYQLNKEFIPLRRTVVNEEFQVPEYFHLFNIRSNEWIVFKNDPEVIDKIIELIIIDKLKNPNEIPNDFIEQNKIKY